MGKNTKVGKARRDKYYKLAKETGYRARSAFKLLQLNRKFEFLQKSKVCIDLCAAPGGWLQVASQHMPVSSVIVGVDLVPIRPVPNCVTLAEDITTDKCRQALKKELQTWKADVVLNDGAPNVGTTWIFDAFAQAELTLHALKLAAEFLRKGGWFVTKVFRSADYHSLMWVFNQLFNKVHATKPQASRLESAEIFVVCQGFVAADKLDPKFFDPKYVFKELKMDTPATIDLAHPEKRSKKAEGYADGDYTLFHSITDVEFLKSTNHLELLAMASEIKLETDFIVQHPLTTTEIKECCKDIKLLGKRDLRALLTWKKRMAPVVEEHMKETGGETAEVEKEGGSEDGDNELDEEDEIQEHLSKLQEEENKSAKKKQKRVSREKRKLRDKMALNMILPGDVIEDTDLTLFSLKQIKSREQLKNVEENPMTEKQDMFDSDEEIERLPKYAQYDRPGMDVEDWQGSASESETESAELEFETDEDEEENEEQMKVEEEEEKEDDIEEAKANPLVVNMESKEQRLKSRTDMWFKKDVFSGLELEKDEDLEIERMTKAYTEKGGVILGQKRKRSKAQGDNSDSGLEDFSSDDNSEEGTVSDNVAALKKKKPKALQEADDTKSERLLRSDTDGDRQKKETAMKEAKEKAKEERKRLKLEAKRLAAEKDIEEMAMRKLAKEREKKAFKKQQKRQELGLAEGSEDEGEDSKGEGEGESSSSSSDSESDEETYRSMSRSGDLTSRKELKRQRREAIAVRKGKKDGFEVVAPEPVTQVKKLDPLGLAIGEEMIKSAKRRREIIDESYNRWTFNDENLPDWFVEDEKHRVKRNMPVTKAQVMAYKERQKLINAAPIKKVAEAKARKKRKLTKRLEKARKKSEAIADTVDVSQKEKVKQMKEVYKKAGLLSKKKEDVQYLVAKRGTGKRVGRPAGVKGKFKVVDPRMKKDNFRSKRDSKLGGKKGGKKGRGKR